MGLGFELDETLSGRFYRFDDPLIEKALRLRLKLAVDGLRRFARARRIAVRGVVFAEGMAEQSGVGRDVVGTVTWKLFDENRVCYALTFTGDDGKTYHLRGQREFFAYDVIGSLTKMSASLYDEQDREIGRATVHFEPRMELFALAKSFRPKVSVPRLLPWRSRSG